MCQWRAAFRVVFVSLCGAAAIASTNASAQPSPVYKDAERFSEPGYRDEIRGAPPHAEAHAFRPSRRFTGGPGYAGSEYGLGKPSFWGLASRPDWGRSNP